MGAFMILLHSGFFSFFLRIIIIIIVRHHTLPQTFASLLNKVTAADDFRLAQD